MARKKRSYAYQQELAKRHGFDSYYQWRKAGFPQKPPKRPEYRWVGKQFASRQALVNAIKRMSPLRIIRVDVWGKPYNSEDQWFNIYAKGTVEEFIRRINHNALSIPRGDASDMVDYKPYSLRWRTK